MSEGLKSKNTVSNEEIVEELTKNLNSSLEIRDEETKPVMNPGTSTENSFINSKDKTEPGTLTIEI